MSKTTPKSKEKDEFVHRKFFIDDTSKNYILIKQNSKIIVIFLKIDADNKIRRIGRVTKSTRTIEMRREMHKHLFRKGDAYGMNDYVLRYQTSFDWVRLSDDMGNHWKIPVSFILDEKNGFYLEFLGIGFEKQKFISLRELEQFRVHKKENRRL